MENDKALTVQSDKVLEVQRELTPEEEIDLSERQAKAMRNMAISRTLPTDWLDMGSGIAYLDDSGASRVAVAWGIDFGNLEFDKETIDGHILYTVTGSATNHRNQSVEFDVGNRSTADDLYRSKWEAAMQHEDPVGRIQVMRDVKKAAVTNLHGRLIRKMTGLNKVPKAEVEAILGTEIGRIERKKGSRGGKSQGATPAGRATDDNAMTKGQFGMLMGLYENNLIEAPDPSEFKASLSNSGITKRRAGTLIDNITKLEEPLSWDAWLSVLKKTDD